MYDLGEQFHIDVTRLKSKPESIIRGNTYRFTVLSERLIRLEYNANGDFNDDATQLVLNRNFEPVNFGFTEDENFLEIKTKYFTLSYVKNTFFKGSVGNSTKNLKVVLNDTLNIWYYNHPEVRNYFGSNVSIEKTKMDLPENKGLYSLEGFVSLDDSNTYRLDPTGSIKEPNLNSVDLYLFVYGKDFGYCLQDYFKLTGNPSLIPRYALGNWWCKEREYTEQEIKDVVQQFKDVDVPISVLLLDKSELNGINENNKTSYSFNNNLIGDPKALIDSLHTDGIRVGLYSNPIDGINNTENYFNEAIKYIEPDKNNKIVFDPKNPKFIDLYFKLFIHPLENYGVDFFWNDYDNLDDIKSLWILNHYHYIDLARNPAKRGMVLSRNSMVSAHRYPVLYSGKTTVSWSNFKKLPFFNISSANIGSCWWSHDIGGFSGGIEESELYLRSVQLGVFSPILRFHAKDGKFYKKEPWKWDFKTNEIVEIYLNLRHQLISYLYSEAYRYYKYGKIVFQPLYYLYPKVYDDELYRNEYFFGSELLIAPIIDKKDLLMNRTIHRFYLPEGTWYDFTTGKKFPGNTKYVSFFKDEDYPVFAKQGSIIPLSIKSNVNNTSNPTDLEIHVFPGKNNTYEMYEDDGISSLYKNGYYLLTSIDYNYMPNNYTLIIRSIEGKTGIVPDLRNYKIRFRNTKQADEVLVYFNNDKIESNNYVDKNDFIVEVNNVKTVGQLTINCKGKDIEIDAVRLINEDIDSILMDLQIETELKEKIDAILSSDKTLREKKIEIVRLKRKGLDPSFAKLFKNLLDKIGQI